MNRTRKSIHVTIAMLLVLCVAFAACSAPAKDSSADKGGVEIAAVTQEAASSDTAIEAPPATTPAATTTPAAVATTPAIAQAATAPAVGGNATEAAVKGADKKSTAKKDASKSKSKSDSKKSSDKAKKDSGAATPPTSSPAAPSKPQTSNKITVSVSIDCLTLYAADKDFANQVSNNGIILAKKNVEVDKDATVYDVLKASGAKFAGKQYISSINGLSEFDAGGESGWTFLVSGVYSGVGVTVYKVKAGDDVRFRYTLNGGKDVQ